MSLKILHEDRNAQLLIITPLLTGHSISGETKVSIKRNKLPYIWASYMADGKHAQNVQKGLSAYRRKTGGTLPPYIQIIDRDIILGRHMLDKMYANLVKTDDTIGFTYVPFSYKGYVNVTFQPTPYDINKLVQQNYISSNSMYKTKMVERVGGFVTDEDVHRLSDWCLWLKCYGYGYIGKLCPDASFIAMSTDKDISAGSNEEYTTTRNLVFERFIKPLLRKEER